MKLRYGLSYTFWTDRTGISSTLFSYFMNGERNLSDVSYNDLEQVGIKVKKALELLENEGLIQFLKNTKNETPKDLRIINKIRSSDRYV